MTRQKKSNLDKLITYLQIIREIRDRGVTLFNSPHYDDVKILFPEGTVFYEVWYNSNDPKTNIDSVGLSGITAPGVNIREINMDDLPKLIKQSRGTLRHLKNNAGK